MLDGLMHVLGAGLDWIDDCILGHRFFRICRLSVYLYEYGDEDEG